MNTMRYAIFKKLEESTLISSVYNAEDRVMAPEESAEPYVVLSEIPSQLNGGDNSGSYTYRATVHVLRGQLDLGEAYLQSLSELFRSNISVEDGDPPETYYFKVDASEIGSWGLEEIDRTIARNRTLVVPAWG